MTGSLFQDIEKLEADLWAAADKLRANSKLTSRDYFLPVLGNRSRPEIDGLYLDFTIRYRGPIWTVRNGFTGATIKHLPREKLALVIIDLPTKRITDLFSE